MHFVVVMNTAEMAYVMINFIWVIDPACNGTKLFFWKNKNYKL